MGTAVVLLLIGGTLAVLAPRALLRARWHDREPVVALWLWQCVVNAVLLCFGLALLLLAAAAWSPVREHLFHSAPSGVPEAYGFTYGGPWRAVSALLLAAIAAYLMLHLLREVRIARISRHRRYRALSEAAPLLPSEQVGRERLVVLESARPEAWSLPVPLGPLQLVVSTGAMRRLSNDQLDALFAHERSHAHARHHWLLQSAGALATAFPRVRLFTAFAERAGELVEMAADDAAARRHGRLATALALLDLNGDRTVFRRGTGGRATPEATPSPPSDPSESPDPPPGAGGTGAPVANDAPWAPGSPPPAPVGQVAERVDRLLVGRPRLQRLDRLRLTAGGLVLSVVPVLLAFVPGLAVYL